MLKDTDVTHALVAQKVAGKHQAQNGPAASRAAAAESLVVSEGVAIAWDRPPKRYRKSSGSLRLTQIKLGLEPQLTAIAKLSARRHQQVMWMRLILPVR